MKTTCAALLAALLATAAAVSPPAAHAQYVPGNDVHAYLLDWARLGRYRDENARLPPPTPGEPRVVFLGDSITDDWGRKAGDFFPGKPYVNRGIGGQTTPQMLLRLREDVIALRPAVVAVLAGTNDISANTGPVTQAQIQGYVSSIVELAHAHGIRVVLGTVLPVTDAHAEQTRRRPPARIDALNDWIRGYCAAGHCTVADYHAALVGEDGLMPPELSDDGLHPNAAGYARMEPVAQAAIARALAAPARGPRGRSR